VRPELERIYSETLQFLPRCAVCGKPIQLLHSWKYCSDECAEVGKRKRDTEYNRQYTKKYYVKKTYSTHQKVTCKRCGERGILICSQFFNRKTGRRFSLFFVRHNRLRKSVVHYVPKSALKGGTNLFGEGV